MTLQILSETDEAIPVRYLSERIAALETGQRPPPQPIRHSVYVALLQTHLPKLDDLDVIAFDEREKLVKRSSSADQVATVMRTDQRSIEGMLYGFVSIAGLGIIAASMSNTPLLAPRVAFVLAGLLLLTIGGSAMHRAHVNGWPGLNRLRTK